MLILASKSPRRIALLKKVVDQFAIMPADIDESMILAPASEMAKETSKMKAYKIATSHPEDTILAVDTIVVFNHQIFGKPKSKKEAETMLKTLSGKRHLVISGYTLVNKNKEINRSEVTEVYFNDLSQETIEAYIASGSPFDKAGGYGIQDEEFGLVKKIVGSYDNVMGLPTEALKKLLTRSGDFLSK
ncbi:MAG: Maf family protein [Bacilli bacterium]